MDAAWRTVLDPEHTARYGCGEVHVAAFEHVDDPGGPWRCIAIQIPETPRSLVNEALRTACRLKGRILILADTPEQIARAVARIERRCPHHRRVAYERAAAAALGPLQ